MVPTQERKRKSVNLTLPLAPVPQYTWDNGLVRKDAQPGFGATDAGSSLAMLWSELGGTDAFSSPLSSPGTPGTPLPSSAIIIGEEGVERLLRSPRTPSAPPISAIPAHLSNLHSSSKRSQSNCATPTSSISSSSSERPPLTSAATPITAICLTTPLASQHNLLTKKPLSSAMGSRGAALIANDPALRFRHNPGCDSPLPLVMSPRDALRIREHPDVPVDWVC